MQVLERLTGAGELPSQAMIESYSYAIIARHEAELAEHASNPPLPAPYIREGVTPTPSTLFDKAAMEIVLELAWVHRIIRSTLICYFVSNALFDWS